MSTAVAPKREVDEEEIREMTDDANCECRYRGDIEDSSCCPVHGR